MFVSSNPRVGDKVRLTRDVEVVVGTFYKDSEFTINSFGSRGPNLVDEDGEDLLECAFITPYLQIWRGEWVPYEKRF